MVDLKRRTGIVPTEAAKLVDEQLRRSDAPEAHALATLVVGMDKIGQLVDNHGEVLSDVRHEIGEVKKEVANIKTQTFAAALGQMAIPVVTAVVASLTVQVIAYKLLGIPPL